MSGRAEQMFVDNVKRGVLVDDPAWCYKWALMMTLFVP
jgi:hypothetical protein